MSTAVRRFFSVRGHAGSGALALGVAAMLAHPAPLPAQAVVQPLPNPAAADLSDALRRLSANPQSLSALIDAGRASLQLEDMDAAAGFYTRAEAIAPTDGRVLAGLAQVALARQDALGALQLFDRAEVAGEPLDALAAQRGLAYDLVGMNTRAQVLYGQALGRRADDETVRRLALSYAIGGDRDAAEATLLPLLQEQDLAAYRTRAFALAIGGRTEEAVSIAETMLPGRIAQRLAPYLRNMPQLTRAQQALAANFGTFPHPEAIGRDDPAIAAYAAGEPAPVLAQGSADSRLVPSGAPLGPAPSSAAPQLAQQTQPAAASAVTSQQVVQELPPLAQAGGPADPGVATPSPSPVLQGDAERLAAAAQGAAPGSVIAQPVVQDLPAAGEPAPGASASTQSAGLAASNDQAPLPDGLPAVPLSPAAEPALAAAGPGPAAGAPATTQQPELRVQLAEVFADFQLGGERPVRPTSADAVDITRITPPREVPPAEEPPARRLPMNPSRHWVQVATGQDVSNFRYDWMRIARVAAELLDGYQPYYAAWNSNNRLVTGPFASEDEAQAVVSRLAARSIASFVFTSSNGERVIPLP